MHHMSLKEMPRSTDPLYRQVHDFQKNFVKRQGSDKTKAPAQAQEQDVVVAVDEGDGMREEQFNNDSHRSYEELYGRDSQQVEDCPEEIKPAEGTICLSKQEYDALHHKIAELEQALKIEQAEKQALLDHIARQVQESSALVRTFGQSTWSERLETYIKNVSKDI